MSAATGKFACLPACVLAAWLGLLGVTQPLLAQTTVGTGSIVGTVSDPSGAVISGARITITNVATRQVTNLATSSSGSFNSGALIPSDYKTLVSAKGFSSAEVLLTVLIGNTATANVKLHVGQETQVVEVQESEVRVWSRCRTVPRVAFRSTMRLLTSDL